MRSFRFVSGCFWITSLHIIFLIHLSVFYSHCTFDFCNRALTFHLENRCEVRNRVFDLGQNYFRAWKMLEKGRKLDSAMLDGYFFWRNSITILSISLFGKLLLTSIYFMGYFSALNSSQVEQMLYARSKKPLITAFVNRSLLN